MDMAPSNIYNNIFYLHNTSYIIGQLHLLINAAIPVYGDNITLDKVFTSLEPK